MATIEEKERTKESGLTFSAEVNERFERLCESFSPRPTKRAIFEWLLELGFKEQGLHVDDAEHLKRSEAES